VLAALAVLGFEPPALILGLVGTVGFALGALGFGLRRRAEQARVHLAKAGSYAVALAVGLAAGAYFSEVARTRAGTVIAALDRLERAGGEIPEGLEALVPDHLEALPAPSSAPLGQARFLYRRIAGGYVLGYRVGGLAVHLYTSADRTWRVRD